MAQCWCDDVAIARCRTCERLFCLTHQAFSSGPIDNQCAPCLDAEIADLKIRQAANERAYQEQEDLMEAFLPRAMQDRLTGPQLLPYLRERLAAYGKELPAPQEIGLGQRYKRITYRIAHDTRLGWSFDRAATDLADRRTFVILTDGTILGGAMENHKGGTRRRTYDSPGRGVLDWGAFRFSAWSQAVQQPVK